VAAEAPGVTASRLGLAILTALAVVLGLILALDRPPAVVAASRRLLPDFDPARVTHLRFARADRTVTLERGDGGWRVIAPSPGPADPAVVDDVLGALELASATRWIDRADADRAGAHLEPPRVRIDADGWALAIGAPSGEELVWAARAGDRRAALVEAWVARALDRDVGALRARAVVPVASPTGIELHSDVEIVLSGAPLRAHIAAGVLRLAPERAAALVDALTALRFDHLPEAAPATDAIGTLRVLGGDAPIDVELHGPCPGDASMLLLAGSRGSGCVARAAWDAVVAAARAIAERPLEACDPRPLLAAPVTRLAFSDGTTLDARGGDWSISRGTVDDQAAADLLAALTAPGTVRAAAAAPATPVLTVTYADGTVDELALSDDAVRRGDEPCAIAIPHALAQRLTRGAAALADRTLIDEDPYLLRTITVDGRVITMGATFEAWTSPDGAVDAAALTALRDLASSLTADELLPPSTPIAAARRLQLAYEAAPIPNAAPATHAITISRPSRDGRCRAKVDAIAALLPADVCTTLLAPLLR